MNILSHNYILCLKNLIKDLINNKFDSLFDSLNPNNSVFNYINILSNLDSSFCDLAKQSLILTFKLLDDNFKNSPDRKSKYYIKSHMSRSIMTIFGEITFKRTFYESKVDGSSFCFLDRYLGLHKYDYFDPYINISFEKLKENFESIIEFKKNHPETVLFHTVSQFFQFFIKSHRILLFYIHPKNKIFHIRVSG